MRAPPALLDLLPPALAVALRTAAEGVGPAALTDAEQARMATFGSAGRRLGFGLGRTAARALATDAFGPDAPPLDVSASGALTLAGRPVSISHAGRGAGALAVAVLARDGRPVGVDLEAICARHPDLAARIVRDDERALLGALGGPTDRALTLVWSLKEAVLKAECTGLRAGTQSVRLALRVEPPSAAPDAGHGTADGPHRAGWRLAWADLGGTWLSVAWADRPGGR